jgi:hypothetical protein
MNRLFRAALVAAILPAGLASVGCAHKSGSGCGDASGCGGAADGGCGAKYRNCVDVAWPDRYNYAARQAVVAPFAQQVATGHFLHQSIWNFYFEPGTDKLTPGGIDKLDALARTTPAPDTRIYIQTAHDIAVTPENIDKVVALRNDLNGKRAAAIKKHMATQFGPAAEYEVYVHDAPVPGISGVFAGNAYRGQGSGYVGGLDGGAGGAPSVGGANRGSLSGPPVGSGYGNTTVNVTPPAPAAPPAP